MIKLYVHLVFLGIRVSVFNFIFYLIFLFGRREREACLALKKGLSWFRNVDLLVFLMLGDELSHDAANRPHLDALVVVILHENDLRSSIPPADHVRSHHEPVDGDIDRSLIF